MMERVRILLVAAPAAPIRDLAPRFQDPELEVIVCGSAREALDRLGASLPDLVVLDGTLPRPDVVRLYGRLRASVVGSNVPILFTSHDESSVDLARTTAPDFYVGSDATFEEIEQLLFSFLPDALFEEDAAKLPRPVDRPVATAATPAAPAPEPTRSTSWSKLGEQIQAGPAKRALAYLGVYLFAELVAAIFDSRLGLLIHAGLLLAAFFHGANVPAGPERSFLWTLWLAPLTRIYGLAQPFAGATPLTWWALTTVPMAVAGLVAMKLAGQSPRDAGLIPSMREAPIAVFMVPVGLAVGVLMYLLLEPRSLGQEQAFGGAVLVALIAIMNPGIVDEVVFRGVLQRGSSSVLGTGFGIVYVSLFYATVMPAGLVERGSLTAIAVMFLLGLVFAAVTARTGSVLSAAVGHASLALGLFVMAPYLMPNGLGPATGTTGAPATADVRLPTPRPAVIVASPPASVSPQPSPAGQASPPPGGPTPITLAPPLAPPAQAPGAVVQTQAAVVRGTGGSGARLREQPGNSGAIITVVSEGTPLLVIGADRTVDVMAWRNVRAPNGNEGWIAAQFVSSGQ
jgi:membrane protease YdiL (CAAX protease family)/DNA-binding NarL/FixJ family response regulator